MSNVTPPRYCIRCGNAFTAGAAEEALCAECSGTPAAPEPQGGAGILRPGQVVADIYTIERELGRGGMGVVYLAREQGSGRLAAIKSPLGEFLTDKGARQRFSREATAWMELGAHPNVVRAFDVKEVDFLPRIFMEYCEGGSLDVLVAQNPGGMPWQPAYDLGAQICWAVGYAHEKGQIHRDLKPANVLLSGESERKMTAKVTDFGLVRRIGDGVAAGSDFAGLKLPDVISAGSESISSGQAMGTPPYMSPEQWTGQDVGPAADIYALGLILFELLTGRRAFDVKTHPYCRNMDLDPRAMGYFYRHLHSNESPLDPRETRPDLPAHAAELLLRCMAKDPAARPASALQVAEGLARALSGCGIDTHGQARPDAATLSALSRKDHAWALLRLAGGAWRRGDMGDAAESSKKALVLFQESADRPGAGAAMNYLGNIAASSGRYDEAVQLYQQALSLQKELGRRAEAASTTLNLGHVFNRRGEFPRALALYEEALRTYQGLGDRKEEASCLMAIAVIHHARAEYTEAEALYHRALAVRSEMGDMLGVADCRVNLGDLYARRGEHDRALAMHQQALEMRRSAGSWAGVADCYINMSIVHDNRGDSVAAEGMILEALKIRQEIGNRAGVAQCHFNLGAIYNNREDYQKAEESCRRALPILEEMKDQAGLGHCLLTLANSLNGQHAAEESLQFYHQALAVLKTLGNRALLSDCYCNMGMALEDLDRKREARKAYQEGIQIKRELRLEVPRWLEDAAGGRN
jgi:serine/threonine protein kinase/lipopolysaccharide biosynthesis regulator YciM